MSNELTKTNTGYVIQNASNDVTEGIAEELNGLNISLDKVKIPAGGGLAFEVPGERTLNHPTAKKKLWV